MRDLLINIRDATFHSRACRRLNCSCPADDGCGKVNESQDVASHRAIAGRNGSELFEFAKEIPDQIPCLVRMFVIGASVVACTFWRATAVFPA